MRLDFPCGLWGQGGWGWADQWEFPKGSGSCALWRGGSGDFPPSSSPASTAWKWVANKMYHWADDVTVAQAWDLC